MVERRGNKFFQDIEVPCYDVDASFRLKPASFMDFAQEIGNMAADGMTEAVELGPGKVLQGLIGRTCKDVAVSGME